MQNKHNFKVTSFQFHSIPAVTVSVGPTSSEPVMRIPDINSPQNVAVGKNGEIVVTSYQSHEALVYSKEGKLVTKFGGQGFTEGKFLCPSGVAVDEDNNILVACYHKLQRFTIDGQFIDGIGGQGQGELEFMVPSGVAIDKEGKIYVAEMMNNRVQVLNADLTYHGSFSKASESLGSGRLNQPQGVAVNSEGKVFVADTMNHAVQVFSQKGEFLFKFGKSGTMMEPGVTSTPMAVAIDLQDNVYVGSATGTISIFSKDGEFVMSFGGYGSELGKFSTIRGMHIDKRGLLYVCEWITNRIQVFQCFSHAEQNKEDVATTAAATAQLASNQELHVDTTKGDSILLRSSCLL